MHNITKPHIHIPNPNITLSLTASIYHLLISLTSHSHTP